MPRYFLHIHNSTGDALDPDGRVLPSLEVARSEAVVGIRSLLAEEIMEGSISLKGRVDIVSEDGELLDSVAFSEAVEWPQELTPDD